MRRYSPNSNLQGKAYYNDRFWVAPPVPSQQVEAGSFFAGVVEALGQEAQRSYIVDSQLIIHIDAKKNVEVMKRLKEEFGFAQCSEQSAVDYLEQENGFELFWQLLNVDEAKRIRLIAKIQKDEAVQSVHEIYRSALFAEREIYDMFGIHIANHPYLKRIIMPDDWEGHPLLKSYPLVGDEHASWYEVDKIFGKEYREIIGPENRDTAMIDPQDTKRFSRLGKEVDFGAEYSDEEQPVEYSKAALVDYNKSSKQLDKRK